MTKNWKLIKKYIKLIKRIKFNFNHLYEFIYKFNKHILYYVNNLYMDKIIYFNIYNNLIKITNDINYLNNSINNYSILIFEINYLEKNIKQLINIYVSIITLIEKYGSGSIINVINYFIICYLGIYDIYNFIESTPLIKEHIIININNLEKYHYEEKKNINSNIEKYNLYKFLENKSNKITYNNYNNYNNPNKSNNYNNYNNINNINENNINSKDDNILIFNNVKFTKALNNINKIYSNVFYKITKNKYINTNDILNTSFLYKIFNHNNILNDLNYQYLDLITKIIKCINVNSFLILDNEIINLYNSINYFKLINILDDENFKYKQKNFKNINLENLFKLNNTQNILIYNISNNLIDFLKQNDINLIDNIDILNKNLLIIIIKIPITKNSFIVFQILGYIVNNNISLIFKYNKLSYKYNNLIRYIYHIDNLPNNFVNNLIEIIDFKQILCNDSITMTNYCYDMWILYNYIIKLSNNDLINYFNTQKLQKKINIITLLLINDNIIIFNLLWNAICKINMDNEYIKILHPNLKQKIFYITDNSDFIKNYNLDSYELDILDNDSIQKTEKIFNKYLNKIKNINTTKENKSFAIQKLKEIKTKNNENYSKALQYLDGFVKIPFGIIKKENVITENNLTLDKIKNVIINIIIYSNQYYDKFYICYLLTNYLNNKLLLEQLYNKYNIKNITQNTLNNNTNKFYKELNILLKNKIINYNTCNHILKIWSNYMNNNINLIYNSLINYKEDIITYIKNNLINNQHITNNQYLSNNIIKNINELTNHNNEHEFTKYFLNNFVNLESIDINCILIIIINIGVFFNSYINNFIENNNNDIYNSKKQNNSIYKNYTNIYILINNIYTVLIKNNINNEKIRNNNKFTADIELQIINIITEYNLLKINEVYKNNNININTNIDNIRSKFKFILIVLLKLQNEYNELNELSKKNINDKSNTTLLLVSSTSSSSTSSTSPSSTSPLSSNNINLNNSVYEENKLENSYYYSSDSSYNSSSNNSDNENDLDNELDTSSENNNLSDSVFNLNNDVEYIDICNYDFIITKIKNIIINSNLFYYISQPLCINSIYNNINNILINPYKNLNNSKLLFLKKSRNVLDKSIYGQEDAKKEIIRIFGQWLNGNQNGYVLGFEGAPGLGKTSLAKYGISKALIDNNGNTRPFGFIALGGNSNTSLLEGHGYTYVDSIWGKIVNILMESKCMNPIIFIDELDKISNTDHGKEIIGLLTHMTDRTQNDSFNDKYFNGVKIDLSKVLFIFSYNDYNKLDSILADRIHRVYFENYTISDKIKIARDYLIPTIMSEINIFNYEIQFPDNSLKYLIKNYTYEAGVRKLKEKLYQIYRELNIRCIENNIDDDLLDEQNNLIISSDLIDDILNIYYKHTFTKPLPNPEVGIVYGLYATALGNGGLTIIQINKKLIDFNKSLLCTGKQGDVMKESMQVSLTLASNIVKQEYIKKLQDDKGNMLYSFHIHCPDGATSKDGPSAGCAITAAIISLIINIPIRNDISMTGEIDIKGNVLPIGGVRSKINGSKTSGIRNILIPFENKPDIEKIKTKQPEILDKVNVIYTKTIYDVLEHVFYFNNNDKKKLNIFYHNNFKYH
jgi:ATP-dependent Lon protease